jgi:hypothetical protein
LPNPNLLLRCRGWAVAWLPVLHRAVKTLGFLHSH